MSAAHAAMWGWTGRIVSTPATNQWPGGCPVKLTGTDEATVHEWVERVIRYGHREKRSHYAESALRYFVRCFYDLFSEEYKEVCGHIATATPDNAPSPAQSSSSDEEMLEPPKRKKVKIKKKVKPSTKQIKSGDLGSLARDMGDSEDIEF